MSSIRTDQPDEDWALSNAYWIILLSNGQVAYEDYEIEKQGRSAWLELKAYITEHNLRIQSIMFKFRSNQIVFTIEDNVEYISLAKGLGKGPADEVETGYFVLGVQSTPTILQKYWFRKPELTVNMDMLTGEEISACKPEFLLKMPV